MIDHIFARASPECGSCAIKTQFYGGRREKVCKREKVFDIYVIDAADKVLGRVAVEAANILRGKNKTIFTPHVDCGDFVIIVNADKVVLTGNKENAKIYTRFSGYVGGKQVDTPRKIRARRPELLLELAVKGMVPHTRLGRQQMTKLKVYAGASHPHEAQQPTAITL